MKLYKFMSKHAQIINARGSACPYTPDKIARESDSHQTIQNVLHESGYIVKSLGNSTAGLDLSELLRAVDWRKGASMLHLFAHGNIDANGQHFLQLREDIADRKNGRVLARDLFRWIAARRNGVPINIFMQSCGSGASCEDAVSLLPPGSTVTTMAPEHDISSYSFNAAGYRHAKEPAANPAERLFLNMLCCGMKDAPNYPQVTISQGEAGIENIWSLWDMARLETLDDLEDFSPITARVTEKLDRLLTPTQIRESLATMRLFLHAQTIPAKTDPESPIAIPFMVDAKSFHNKAADANLVGPMCAIAYVVNRDIIGAFQTWPKDRYIVKPSRPKAAGLFTSMDEPTV